MSRNPNELVVIYIWKGSETQCGHASLQTYSSDGKTSDEGGIYASFWPVEGVHWGGMKTFTNHHEGVLGTLHDDFTTDKECEAEGLPVGKKRAAGQPDLEIKLYGLDVGAINAAFNQFKNSKCNWSIFGSTFFRKENTRNCSGLVSYLLYEGGIAKKRSSYASLFRKGLGALAGIAAFFLVLKSEDGAEKRRDMSFFTALAVSGAAGAAGGLVGGAVGGVADGISDVAKINEAITCMTNYYSSPETSFWFGAGVRILKFLLYPTGIVVNGVSGAVFIDHPMQSLLMTPNHVADLATSAVEAPDDIDYPRAMKLSGSS